MAPEHADVPDASAICFSSGLATTEQAPVSSPRLQSRTQARATSAADGGLGFACATAGTSSVARRTAIRLPGATHGAGRIGARALSTPQLRAEGGAR